jgi:hypothetical protein
MEDLKLCHGEGKRYLSNGDVTWTLTKANNKTNDKSAKP